MEDDEKLEGGIDDTWFHDDVGGKFDDEWQEVIRKLLANEKIHSKIQYREVV